MTTSQADAPPAPSATTDAPVAAVTRGDARRLRRQQRAESRRAAQKAARAARAAASSAATRAEIDARLDAMTDAERAEWRRVRAARVATRRADAAARRARLGAAVAGGAAVRIVIDCGGDYPSMMTPREAASLGQQLRHCVAANARARGAPATLAFVGVAGPTAAAVDAVAGSAGWPVVRVAGDVASGAELVAALPPWLCGDVGAAVGDGGAGAAGDPPPVVYLSADADDELEAGPIAPGTTLIIGGLVDRNRHRGAALARAAALGVRAARLPLRLALTSSAVLTVDCVFRMVLDVAGGATWDDAAVAAVPRRKQKDGGGWEDGRDQGG